MEQAVAYLNAKYGSNTVELTLKDSYYNMLEKIKPHFELIETAKKAMGELDVYKRQYLNSVTYITHVIQSVLFIKNTYI